MKNSLNISVAGEDLISTVDDSTNRLFINGTEVPSTSWTGSGTYSTTVNGHAITITQVEDTTGNVAIRRTAAYTYELYKIRTGTTINGDLIVTGDIYEQGAKLATRYQSNRNLLDNWYFVGGGSQQGYGVFPINQRRATSYTNGNGQYCMDRWRSSGASNVSNVTIESGDVKVVTTGQWAGLQQRLFFNPTIAGKTVTFSALMDETSGSGQFIMIIDTYDAGGNRTIAKEGYHTVTSTNKDVFTVTGTLPSSFSYARVCIWSTNNFPNRTFRIYATKLEYGTKQTLAHQENGSWVLNELPDYDEQWTKCRKYLITSTWGTEDFLAGYGKATNATTVDIFFPIGGMVKKPTISPTTGSNWSLKGNGQAITPTGISSWFASANVLGVRFTASGLTANQIYIASPDSATLVTFSAEP